LGSAKSRPSLWVTGDWNGFFGFGTNILVNLLVLTGLLRFVLGMPEEVFLDAFSRQLG
jgi:adenine/guanine/hypoxanthine permease